MNLPILLCLIILVNVIDSAPDKFRFTSQPTSEAITTGGTVTLSCEATGRTGITYTWYKHASGFTVPPDSISDTYSEEIDGEIGISLTVPATDVDGTDEKKMFQCKATAGDELIFSNVARISYTAADDIQFSDNDVTSVSKTSGTDLGYGDPFIFKLQCNDNYAANLDDHITNGVVYNVYWYKDSDSTRVEDNYNNMWTSYGSAWDTIKTNVIISSDDAVTFTLTLKRYDLLIYNIQTSDAGTYKCKAVSENSTKLLGTTIVTVGLEENGYTIETTDLVTGYTVQAVTSAGVLKTLPNVGDDVLLMCGAACKTTAGSSGSNVVSYQWKDKNGNDISGATSREYTVTTSSAGELNYRCSTNCSSTTSSAMDIIVEAADPSTYTYSFSSYSPEYIWYDTSDTSAGSFEIDCAGTGTSGVTFQNTVYKSGVSVDTSPPYDFPAPTSNDSGVYQCAFRNNGDNVLWVQKTTEVVIATDPTATVTPPTTQYIEDGTTANFTCTIDVIKGLAIKSVTITGPRSLSLNCLTTPSSGDVSCSTTDDINYVIEISTFAKDEYATYTCTVETSYWTDDSTEVTKTGDGSVALTYVKSSTTTLSANSNPVNKGDPVTLTCVVEGDPAPSKPTLTKDGTTNIALICTGTTTKSCTKVFTSVEYTDNGNYKCDGINTVNGEEKTSTSSLSLTVNGDVEASLTLDPDQTEFDKDARVTFTCTAEGNPLPTKLTFKNTDESINKEYDSSDSDITTGAYNISYTHTIDSLQLSHTSTYTCTGENNNGGVKTNAATKDIAIGKVTKILELSSNTTYVLTGEAFEIKCLIEGEASYVLSTVSWSHSTAFFDLTQFVSTVIVDTYTLASTLVVPQATIVLAGNFICNVGDLSRNVTINRNITVYIRDKPYLDEPVLDTHSADLSLGDNITFNCQVSGFGIKYVELMRLYNDEEIPSTLIGEGEVAELEGIISFREFAICEARMYVCNVGILDKVGMVSMNRSVTVPAPPVSKGCPSGNSGSKSVIWAFSTVTAVLAIVTVVLSGYILYLRRCGSRNTSENKLDKNAHNYENTEFRQMSSNVEVKAEDNSGLYTDVIIDGTDVAATQPYDYTYTATYSNHELL